MAKPKPAGLWIRYKAKLHFTTEFAASLPKKESEIRAMLEHRMPTRKPDDATPIDELVEQVKDAVQANGEGDVDESFLPGWATFKHDDKGLFYEGRCVRGHLKECARTLIPMMKKAPNEVKNFGAKAVSHMYVVEDKLPVYRDGARITEPDDMEQRFIQVMTRQGPRSSIKYIDYVRAGADIRFTLALLNDGEITEGHVRMVLDYGMIHGMGQERSQGWGRYEYALTLIK